jgi:hypothetical protein
MARYIDAEPMLRETIEERKFVFAMEDAKRNEIIVRTVYKDLYEFIEAQPTADVVEVVRCKDCKFYFPPFCNRPKNKPNHTHGILPNGFCSYGERRDT